jgi:hypothetical protein
MGVITLFGSVIKAPFPLYFLLPVVCIATIVV